MKTNTTNNEERMTTKTCDNCGQPAESTTEREYGMTHCDPCHVAQLEYGHRQGLHVDEANRPERVEGCPLCPPAVCEICGQPATLTGQFVIDDCVFTGDLCSECGFCQRCQEPITVADADTSQPYATCGCCVTCLGEGHLTTGTGTYGPTCPACGGTGKADR